MSNNLIRVLLVDDSYMAREMLCSILGQEDGIEVVGEACNGRQAVELAETLKPDLVTMDLEMPVMNGLEAIAAIMGKKAVPILVVSGVSDAQKAYEATRRGALEVVGKPDCTSESAAEFVNKVRLLAGVRVITHIRPVVISANRQIIPEEAHSAVNFQLPELQTTHSLSSRSRLVFAIASSTGGPQVLSHILPLLPADFPCPVLIAQHISEGFAAGMAEWLGGLCRLPVRIARHGEDVIPGTVYIAPAEFHCMVSHSKKIVLVDRGEGDIYRPSCDRLLSSVAEVYRCDAVGIILTGMGHDGADGIARIRECGGITLGQDSKSSDLYGMNRCAIEAGTVQKVLSEFEILAEILSLASGGKSL